MGNGIEALHNYSAWIRNTKIIDNSTVEKYPEWVHEYKDEPDLTVTVLTTGSSRLRNQFFILVARVEAPSVHDVRQFILCSVLS